MPTLNRAPAMGAVLLAFVAALTSSFGVTRHAAADSSSSAGNAIASRALVDLDTYQGQCYTWMEQVVSDAIGVDVGNDYRQGYLDAGFVEVTRAQAGLGDIVRRRLGYADRPSSDRRKRNRCPSHFSPRGGMARVAHRKQAFAPE